MLWVLPAAIGLGYLLFGRKSAPVEEETSSEESPQLQQTMGMKQTLTAAQAEALGFAPEPKPKFAAVARKAQAMNKMTMKARVGPPRAAPPQSIVEAAAAAAKLAGGPPNPFTGKGGTAVPQPQIAPWSADASASFDLTTKLK